MSDLPSIFDEAITDIVTRNVKFSTVKSGTGTGKTTTFPSKLCKYMNKNFKVCVVLPTKEAVYNAYERVYNNKVHNVNVTFNVGYAANAVIKYKNDKISFIRNILYNNKYVENKLDEQLVFCTTGHFKNVLRDAVKYLQEEDYINPRFLDIFDYVIIDEAHLKSMDIDIILGILKYMLISFKEKFVPSVICTSATYSEPKLYEIGGVSPYNVDVIYVDTGSEDMFDILDNIAEGFYEQLVAIENKVTPGKVLIFLPGIKEINNVKSQLLSADYKDMLEIFIAHSSRTKEQLKDIFTDNTPGKWKIILSTNITETSLTIPNISIIVDSCIENVRVMGQSKTIYNKMQFISKDSAEQRKGRTGRTCNGIVLRMVSREKFDSFPESRIPEIERLPLTNELLYILDCNIDIRFIFGDINNGINRSLSKNQNNRLNQSLKELEKLKLIKKCSEYYNVTEVGKFCSALNLSAKSTVILNKALEEGIDPYPVIVFVCALENAEILFKNFKPIREFMSSVPFTSIINPWLKMCLKYANLKVPMSKLINFCKDNDLNIEGFQDMQRKIIHCINHLQLKGYDVEIFVFDPEEIFLLLKPILNNLYFTYERQAGKETYMSVNKSVTHKPLRINDRFIINDTFPEKVTSILNMKIGGSIQMILWYPYDYKAKNEGVNNEEFDIKEFDTLEDDEYEEEFDMLEDDDDYEELIDEEIHDSGF